MSDRKVDAWSHVIPPGFLEPMSAHLSAHFRQANVARRPALWDLGARFRMMDRYPGYVQVVTLASPAIEEWATGDAGLALARLANECLAEAVRRNPDRLVGFAAAVMLEDVEGSVREAERAVAELGALGVQIYTNVNGRPLDAPRFEPFFAAMAALDRPIWAHPTRPRDFADYRGETGSRYGIGLKFGWPYETVVFMTRLIFSGLMDRHPGLRILTHHAGGFVPHLVGRLGLQHETPEQRAEIGVDERFDEAAVVESYRRFYGDVVFSGGHHPLTCSLEFFGPDRLLFATDTPFGAEGGEMFIRETIAAVERLAPGEAVRRAIYEDNARRVLGVA